MYLNARKEELAEWTIRSHRYRLKAFVEWCNEHRPHEYLGGKTPNEVYFRRFPANRKPRFEPRPRWPKRSPCASPQAPPLGEPGMALELVVSHHGGRKHLPVIQLKQVA